MLARDDDPDLVESYDKRIRDRLAAEEELDAIDLKRRERDLRADNNLERFDRFDKDELDGEGDQEEDEEMLDGVERGLNLEAFDCPLKEWIAEERTRREIARRFKKFLQSYYPGIDEVTTWVKRHEHINPLPPLPSHLKISPPIYPSKIRYDVTVLIIGGSAYFVIFHLIYVCASYLLLSLLLNRAMCAANSASLEITYGHLAEMQSQMAIWLTDVPRDMLQIMDEVLQSVVLADFPHYKKVCTAE